jgi:hypothetical protein
MRTSSRGLRHRIRDSEQSDDSSHSKRTSRRQKQPRPAKKNALLLSVLAASLPVSMAQQNCVSLQGSSACPAFSAASISTNLTGDLYAPPHLCPSSLTTMCSSFLSFVSDVRSFDDRLRTYIATTYSQRQSVWPATAFAHSLKKCIDSK